MSNVVGSGIARTLVDSDGDSIIDATTGRLKVETEAEGFTEWVNYLDFAAVTGTAQNLNHASHCNTSGAPITNAKEVLIQADDENTGFIMIGETALTTLAGAAGSRAGIKLNGGQILMLAIPTFADIFIIGSAAGQYVNVAYFK